MEVPTDLLLYISFFIQDLKTILVLCSLNKETFNKFSSNLLWKHLLLQRFPESNYFITKEYKKAFFSISKYISMKKKKDFLLTIIGAEGVGKSSLAFQFTRSSFGLLSVSDYDPTINSFIHSTSLQLENQQINVTFLDVAHQTGEFEEELMEHFIINPPDFFMLVFSVENKTSFRYIGEVDKIIKKTFKTEWYPGILIANKIDKTRKIQKEDSLTFAKDRNLLYAETDASKGTKSEQIIVDVVKYIGKHGSFQDPIHQVWKKIENNEKIPQDSHQDDDHWLCNKKYISFFITKVILGLLCIELKFLHYCIERINHTVNDNVKYFK